MGTGRRSFVPMASEQQIALVAGGVRGLGLAVARGLAERGLKVHVTWRGSAERADELRDEFMGRLHQVDLADGDATRAMVDSIVAAEGRLDRVCSSVGGYHAARLDGTDAGTLDALWRSNVVTAMNLLAAVRAPLRVRGGSLLLFGCAGLEGLRARRECAAYAAAKSALLVLTRSAAVEEAPFGVNVNMLSPGLVPHDGAHVTTLDPALQAAIPAGRPGTLDEVSAAACYLMSPEANHVTGTDLVLSGGWML